MRHFLILVLIATGGASSAQPVATSAGRDDLIEALHEIHRDEHLGLNAGEIVTYTAMSAQVLTLATTGALAVLARGTTLRMTPAQKARFTTALDRAVEYAPTTFFGAAAIAVLAGAVGLFENAIAVKAPIDVRTADGFARFLAMPLWRQIQIAEGDPEFEARLIAYARELRTVRESFTPRKS